jgi:signal peptidase II
VGEHKPLKVLYVTLVIVIADQITKILVKGFSIPFLGIEWEGMYYGQTIPLIGDVLRLTYIENPGMAFGIDLGGKVFFALFSIIACIGIFWYLFMIRQERLRIRLPFALILGGAFGNLIDRVFYGVFYGEAPLFQGAVVDFIDVIFFNINIFGYEMTRWPVFNIADSAVTIGVILLLIFHREAFRSPTQDDESGGKVDDQKIIEAKESPKPSDGQQQTEDHIISNEHRSENK